MAKIHLLMRKEEIDVEKVNEGNKIAVVLDVLLATTTITSALHDGALEVIPVMDATEALEISKEYKDGEYILSGEVRARTIDGFVFPSPTGIRSSISGKTLILSTTNGTVALKKASKAKKVFVTSLLNNPAVAEQVRNDMKDHTILVICSGTSGEVSLEDFYGAGHFISCLLDGNPENVELTDAAKAAHLFYKGNEDDAYSILRASHVGQFFEETGSYLSDLSFASHKGSIPIVPVLQGKKVVVEQSVNIHSKRG